MARRRPSRGASSRKKTAKFHRFVCETLEERQLLTVLVSGDTFTWRGPQPGYNIDTISVGGNAGSTELEVVFVRYNNSDGSVSLGNVPGLLNGGGALQPIPVTLPPPPTGTAPSYASRLPYYDDFVWAIYVVKSDASSTIGFEEFNGTTDAPQDYTGSVGGLNLQGMTNRGVIAAPANTGTFLWGGETLELQPITNNSAITIPPQPVLDVPLILYAGELPVPGGTFTDLPSSITELGPGITVAAGNDFGNVVVGGTMIGTVNFGGSLGNFYAGWLLLGSSWYGGNAFTVAGDVNAIISKGSIATDNASLEEPALLDTGFNVNVGGRLGMIRTDGDFLGTVDVTAAATVPGTVGNITTTTTTNAVEARGDGLDGTLDGLIGDDSSSYNDTFNTPQILAVNAAGATSVDGALSPYNYVDYYAVALMAGQTVTVQLSANGEPLDVGIFDPDGVEVATDLNAVNSTFTNQLPFQYTAVKAGLYRFAVGINRDPTFTGTIQPIANRPYNLLISNLGNVSFGGILAAGIVRDRGNGAGFEDDDGDIGAIMAIGGVFESQDNDTFLIDDGSLRAAQGTSLDDTLQYRGITLNIPNGSVGLLSATSGTLTANTDPLAPPLGGNIQLVSATSSAVVDFVIDGSIGVIRAADMASGPSILTCNALDNPNTPATIDLIDVTGDFGSLALGGPHITMGPGGNVKYIHVGGDTYSDSFFGGGYPAATEYQVGEAVQIVDDSGSVVTLTPNAQVTDSTGVVTVPAGQLTITAYGIEGSGGSAIVNVTSTGSVTITVDGDSPGQSAEIGEIDDMGTGTAVVAGGAATTTTTTSSGGSNGGNGTSGSSTAGGTQSIGGQGATTAPGFPAAGQPGGPPIKTGTGSGSGNNQLVALPPAPVLSTTGVPLDLILNGNATADVYSVVGTNFTSIQNQTSGGQIVNVTATSIGNLSSAGSIGLDPGTLGEQVNGATIFSNTAPFVQQHYGLNVSAGIVSISAPQIGNIIEGSLGIGSISGDVLGPIVTAGAINVAKLTGMSWSGSGAPSNSGIFATGTIGAVTSSGDIRGAIVSSSGVRSIALSNNASLINAEILVVTQFSEASALTAAFTGLGVVSPITKPNHDVGSITVSGDGGIIGSLVYADHIGTISSGGFGVFGSKFTTGGDGTLDTLEASGYGIRFTVIDGGASVSNIIAIGNGSNVPTSDFSASVRQSEGGGEFDPNTGLIFSPLNDIDVTLGVTAAQPAAQNVTDTGILEDVQVFVSRNVALISAYAIRSRALVVGGATLPISEIGTVFNIANQIGKLQTTGGIDSVSITTGRIGTFKTDGDTSNFSGTFAGAIGNLIFNSNLDDSSVIDAIGPNGHIGNLIVKGNLAGTIISQTFINKITVGGSITGTITAKRIGTVEVHSGLATGGLVVNGAVNRLIFDGDAGVSGQTITINGNSQLVKVGGNLAASIDVTGKLTQFLVAGSILAGSNNVVGTTLNLLKIGADLQAGASFTAQLIKRQKIGGQVFGTIVVG